MRPLVASRRFGVWVGLLALALSLPLLFQNFRTFVAGANASALYANLAGGDEIFVLGPATTVYQNGYTGLRCRENYTGTCYGGTQILLDGYSLRLLPASWLESGATTRAPGVVAWPYLQTQPRILKALRWSRVVYAGLALAAIAAAAFFLTGDLLLAGLFLAAVGSSVYFLLAWQGAKNDFPSALWEILFALAALRAFRQIRFRSFLLALAIGLLCVFVRPVLLPMLVSFPLAYAVHHWWRAGSIRAALSDLAASGLVLAGGYLLLHPNVLVSSLEANWIIALLHMGTHPASLAERLREFWAALFAGWPWYFVLGLLAARRKELRAEWATWCFFLLNALFLYLVNVKTAHYRIQYYLPAFLLAFPLLAYYWPSTEAARKKAGAAFSLLLILVSLVALFTDGPPRPAPASEPADLEKLLLHPAGSWLIDEALQPPLRLSENSQVEFFDSMAQSPQEIRARFGQLPEHILVTCWKSGAAEFDAPAARSWAGFPCNSPEPLRSTLFAPFVSGIVPTSFLVLSREEFLRAKFPTEEYLASQISPRIFRGFWQGMDNYGSPLLLRKSAVLQAKISFPKPLNRFVWPVASDCKDPQSAVRLSVKVGAKMIAQKTIRLANSSLFCRDYPRLCRYQWFQRWSQRRFPAPEELALAAPIPAHQEIELELRADLNACTLELQNLTFDPAR